MNDISSLTANHFKRAAEIKEKIEALTSQLAAVLNGSSVPGHDSSPHEPAKMGKFSATTRAKMAAAQKARWANLKVSKDGASPNEPEKKKRRKMSASARAKIGAAQKARWAKFHAKISE